MVTKLKGFVLYLQKYFDSLVVETEENAKVDNDIGGFGIGVTFGGGSSKKQIPKGVFLRSQIWMYTLKIQLWMTKNI